jgi:hypothetical protein
MRAKAEYHMPRQLLICRVILMTWQSQPYHIRGCLSIKKLLFSLD